MSKPPRVDVIIAGAGPAGLHAAISAAESGASVLVFDKKTTIGVPVKCGEYFPTREELQDLLPECKDHSYLFEMPSRWVSNTCDTLRLFSPKGKSWQFHFEALVLDRKRMEQDLAKRAERLGADFKLGQPIRVLGKDHDSCVIVVGRETYRAKVVIAADGFPSTVAFLEGLVDERYSSPDNVAVDYQYLMSGVNVEPNVTEMYSGTDLAPGGYAWVIPKSQTTVNVGSGIRTTFPQSRKGIAYLEHFVHNHPSSASKLVDGSIDGVIADVLPVDGAMSKTCSTSVLSVGDAAGMVMATNGGGIPTAIVTGHIAGETAALHVQRGTPLSTYETKWKRALGRQLDASARMRRFADMFMRHDFAFDCALRLLGVRGIRKVLTCKIPMGLGPLMTLLGY